MSAPILIYVPGGGVPVGPVSNPPVYSQSDTTQLIEGQSYVDVVFGSTQTNDDWVLVACEVENTIDADPLNIWPGIITDKTVAGFRIQLNGMPDSSHYYLIWAVSGINITPVPATAYTFSGPAVGDASGTLTYRVSLTPSTTVARPVVVTLSDGGAGGEFSSDTVSLNTLSPEVDVVYTPGSYGAITLSVTNDFLLTDPSDIVLTIPVPTYTLVGPSSGANGVASTNFTVSMVGSVAGTLTVTPASSGGGTFTPTSVAVTNGTPAGTFTYTPSSSGAKTISVTNDGGLANPASLIYTATLADGALISTWPDSSGNGHPGTNSGSARPTFKINIVNGKPVVRFASANSTILNLGSVISGASPWTTLVVMKKVSSGVLLVSFQATAGGPFGPADLSSTYVGNRTGLGNNGVNTYFSAFHVFAALSNGTGTPLLYVDGTASVLAPAGGGGTGDFNAIGSINSDGDIAEVIQYNVDLGATNRANLEKYLGTKYGITVAGGSAVQPDTVTGLVGWWKADSL